MNTLLKTIYCRIESPDFIHRLEKLEQHISQISDIHSYKINYANCIITFHCENFDTTTELRKNLLNQGVRISKPLTHIKSIFTIQNLQNEQVKQQVRQTFEKNIHIKHFSLSPKTATVKVHHDSSESDISILQALENDNLHAEIKTEVIPLVIDRSLDMMTLISGLLIVAAFATSYTRLIPQQLPVEFIWSSAILINSWIISLSGFTLALRKININSGGFFLLATVLALYYDLWQQAALIGFTFTAIKTLERYYWGKARRNLAKLFVHKPVSARQILADDSTQIVEADIVDRHSLVKVKKGEIIPVDGIVRGGKATVQSAILYGNELGENINPDDQVYAGTQIVTGELTIECLERLESSTSMHFFNLIEKCINSTPPVIQNTRRIANWFKYAIILTAATSLGITYHPEYGFSQQWLIVVLSLLVIMQSSATLFSMHLGYIGSIALLGKSGIKIQDGESWQQLQKIRRTIIDSVDILTCNTPEAQEIITLDQDSAADCLRLAASISANSEQAVWHAIQHRFQESDETLIENIQPEKSTLNGIVAHIDNDRYTLGDYAFFLEHKLITDELESRLQTWEQADKSGCMLARNNQIIAIILIKDAARPYAGTLKEFLNAAGIRENILMSSDNPNTGKLFQQQYEYENAQLNLSEQQKQTLIQSYRKSADSTLVLSNNVILTNDWPKNRACLFALAQPQRLDTSNITIINQNSNHLAIALDQIKHQGRSLSSTGLLYMGCKSGLIAGILMHGIGIEAVILIELALALSSLHICTRYLAKSRLLKLPEQAIRRRDLINLPSRPRSLMR